MTSNAGGMPLRSAKSLEQGKNIPQTRPERRRRPLHPTTPSQVTRVQGAKRPTAEGCRRCHPRSLARS